MKLDYLEKVERIIVHGNCPDGMASAIILYDALRIEPEFHIHTTKNFQNLEVTDNTLFCDICPPNHLVNGFVKANGIVLDHHKEVKDSIAKFGDRGVFADEAKDLGVSGASLAFNEVWRPLKQPTLSKRNKQAEKAERISTLAGIRDTWQIDNKLWHQAGHQAAAHTFYPWAYWKNKIDGNQNKRFDMASEMNVGEMIYENRLNKAASCAQDAVISKIGNLKIAVFNDMDRLTSDVSEFLRNDGINIIAGFFYTKYTNKDNNPILSYSVRSDGSVNVGKFATSKGGGGHSKAAGYARKMCFGDDPFSLFLSDFASWVE